MSLSATILWPLLSIWMSTLSPAPASQSASLAGLSASAFAALPPMLTVALAVRPASWAASRAASAASLAASPAASAASLAASAASLAPSAASVAASATSEAVPAAAERLAGGAMAFSMPCSVATGSPFTGTSCRVTSAPSLER